MLKGRVLAGLVIGAVGAAMNTGCATSRDVIATEVARSNTQTVLAFEETAFNKHEVEEAFDRYVGPTYKQHDPQLVDGKDGAVKALSFVLANAFPKSRVIVKRTVAQDDMVAVHVLWVQKPGETRGQARVDLYRLENGRIVEHWDVVQDVPEKSANDNAMF